MGMTLTQKILAAHAGLAEVKAGQLINAKLDIVLGNDITTPVAINEFEKAGFDGVFDKEHIAMMVLSFYLLVELLPSRLAPCQLPQGGSLWRNGKLFRTAKGPISEGAVCEADWGSFFIYY